SAWETTCLRASAGPEAEAVMGPPMDSPVPRVVFWATALPAYSRRASAVARLYLSRSLSANQRVPADAVTKCLTGMVHPSDRRAHPQSHAPRVSGDPR